VYVLVQTVRVIGIGSACMCVIGVNSACMSLVEILWACV